MGKTFLFWFLITVSACAILPAQMFSPITDREPVTSLDMTVFPFTQSSVEVAHA